MYGINFGPGMEPYPPRVGRNFKKPSQPTISQYGWGFHTVRGSVHRGIAVLVPDSSDLWSYGTI